LGQVSHPVAVRTSGVFDGEPVWVPEDADKDDFARLAEQLEQTINALQDRAEAIARGAKP